MRKTILKNIVAKDDVDDDDDDDDVEDDEDGEDSVDADEDDENELKEFDMGEDLDFQLATYQSKSMFRHYVDT